MEQSARDRIDHAALTSLSKAYDTTILRWACNLYGTV